MSDAAAAQRPLLSEEDRSKDLFFTSIAQLAEAMISAHGKEFTMGALILAARFIAEGKPLTVPKGVTPGERSAAATPSPQSPAR
jgi:hypothetical protein